MMLDSLDEFVAEALPDERLLEFDHEDICPEEIVRAMCGEDLGVHLVFIPEEYGGLRRRRVRLLSGVRTARPRRHRNRHLGVRHVPRQRPHPGRRDPRAAQGVAGAHRRAGHPVRLRRHGARGGQRPGRADDDSHPGGDRRAGDRATGSTGASSGSATARSPTSTRFSHWPRAGRPGSSWRRAPPALRRHRRKTSTVSGCPTQPRCSSMTWWCRRRT